MSGFFADVSGLLMRGFRWWGGELVNLRLGRTSSKAPRRQVDATVAVSADGTLRLIDTDRRGRAAAVSVGLDGDSATFDKLSRLQRTRPDAKIHSKLVISPHRRRLYLNN